jgi:hypothetical protein
MRAPDELAAELDDAGFEGAGFEGAGFEAAEG